MIEQRLRELPRVPGLTTRAEADRNLRLLRNKANLYLNNSPEFTKVVQAFCAPELAELAAAGEITIGLIKPEANLGENLPTSDEHAASVILGTSLSPDRLLFAMPWRFTGEDIERFYAEAKEKYATTPQAYQEYGRTVWESLYNHANRGPVTLMLIGGDNPIEWWREQMGPTQPAKAPARSIRGRYAIQEMLPNNLVHGSDSPQSVSSELRVIKDSLLRVHASLFAQSNPNP